MQAEIIDLGANLGGCLDPARAKRVRLFPGTSVAAYARSEHPTPDLIVVSDVLHHVPPPERRQFFADLRTLVGGKKSTLFVKDLEPGSWKATVGYLADRYVSGDKGVSLIGEAALRALLTETFPGASLRSTNLIERDPPNYAVVCDLP